MFIFDIFSALAIAGCVCAALLFIGAAVVTVIQSL